MNELIKVSYEKGNPTVLARQLHNFLDIKSHFKDWFPRMCEYGFVEGFDFTPLIFEHPQNKQETIDYQLTIPMAKEICMIQRTEKGKLARTYFLKIEEAWNSPEAVMARALKMADIKLQALSTENAKLVVENTKLKPKADFFDTVTLYRELRNKKILMKNNVPYQEYVDRGYFCVTEQYWETTAGDIKINVKTTVLQKGLDFIRKALVQ